MAIGKASDALVRAAATALDEAGVPETARRAVAVAHTAATEPPLPWVERLVGGHPLPDESSLVAGRRVLGAVEGCTDRTLVLFLLSGGGSSLAEWPADGRLGARDLARINDALVRSGLPIRSVNAVRKRISAIKGGRLAERARPAVQATFVVSDVAPGDAQSVASGPTVPDETTMAEAVAAVAAAGLAGGRERAALADPPAWRGPAPIVEVLVDCEGSAEAAARAARRLASQVVALGCVDGPLDDVVARHLAELERALAGGGDCAVVSTGEVTVEVSGAGLGGRNQQTVLAAIARVREACPSAREVAILSAGTDGRDGPTDAAGAVATLASLERGVDAADHLERFDAYRFFERAGGLVRTGPTGTNVRDVRVFLGRSTRSTRSHRLRVLRGIVLAE